MQVTVIYIDITHPLPLLHVHCLPTMQVSTYTLNDFDQDNLLDGKGQDHSQLFQIKE